MDITLALLLTLVSIGFYVNYQAKGKDTTQLIKQLGFNLLIFAVAFVVARYAAQVVRSWYQGP